MVAYDAYPTDGPNSLVVRNGKGEILKSVSKQKDWAIFWGWLDNNHIMVTKNGLDSLDIPSLIVVDLNDDSLQELHSDYPNFENVSFLDWQFNRVVYDPTRTIAIFPSYAKKNSAVHGAVTFFDLMSKVALVEIPAIINRTKTPEWSPDGQYVVVAKTTAQREQDPSGDEHYDQELALLDRSGNISQITNFTDKYIDVKLGTVSWAPDGQHIAFWLSIGSDSDEVLAVLDLKANVVTNYCLTGLSRHIGSSQKPVWSHDSRFVLVNRKEDEDTPVKAIWVDIVTREGAIIGDNMSVEGWLASEK
jgi:hypothetical protein